MYKITRDGKTVAMTEAPSYVRRAENGCFTLCQEAEAAGIVHGGQVFHLLGRPDLEGAAATVMLEETDAGPMVAAAHDLSSDVDGLTVDHEYRITLLELGLAADSETV